MQAFVIGDIHGCLVELQEMIKDIDRTTTRIFFVGNLIDRGYDSEGVIDFVRLHSIECVQGNHEQMLIECEHLLTSDASWALTTSDWYANGGRCVLQNYSSIDKLLDDIQWLKTLPTYIETGIKNKNNIELLVSHACTVYYSDRSLVSSMFNFTWERKQPKHYVETDFYNIFGHTPTSSLRAYEKIHPDLKEVAKPIFYPNGCNIDTGCAYNTKGRQYLTGIHFPSLDFVQIKNHKFKE